jgi:histidinol-phosphatase
VTPTVDLLTFALDLADEADRISMSFYRGELGTQRKADGSLVTLADKAVERMLRERIGATFQGHAILGEEEGDAVGGSGEPRWILDPIDGTHGFARGLPVWSTLIAVEVDGRIDVGVASAPALGTRWWAGRGLGAWRGPCGPSAPVMDEGARRGGARIHVSDIGEVADAQILTGGMRHVLERWPNAQRLLDAAWRDRGYGDFWAHCLVAEGAAEAMLEPVCNAWDLAPLIVIVEEAGGRLTDSEGNATIEAGHAVTSNGRVHDEVLRVLAGGEPAAVRREGGG